MDRTPPGKSRMTFDVSAFNTRKNKQIHLTSDCAQSFPSSLSAGEAAAADSRPSAAPRRTKQSLEEAFGADRRRWTGERGRNPFRDVNKIKEPDMIKHEVHYKGNVNLSPDPFIIKNSEPSLSGRQTPANL